MWKYFVAAVSMVSSFGAFSATQDEINSNLDKQLSWISTDNIFQFNKDISLVEFVKLAIKLQPKKFNREFFFKRYTKEYCKDVNKNEFDLNKCLVNDVHADTVIDEYLSKIASEKQENRPTKVGIFTKVDYSNYVFDRAESCFKINYFAVAKNSKLFNYPYDVTPIQTAWPDIQYGFTKIATIADVFPDLYNSGDSSVKRLFYRWTRFSQYYHYANAPEPLVNLGFYAGDQTGKVCFKIEADLAEKISKSNDVYHIKSEAGFEQLVMGTGVDVDKRIIGIGWGQVGKMCLYRNDQVVTCKDMDKPKL